MAFDESVRLIWSLTASGLGTAITAGGNSGPFNELQPTPNAVTLVDLRRVGDVSLSVWAGGVSDGASLTVTLSAFDDQGNLFGPFLTVPAVTAAGAGGAQIAFGGRHGPGSQTAPYFVLPEWGQIAWTVSGTDPSLTDVEIALYGR